MNTYDFKLDIFEGPLDLLLHLIEKNQIDTVIGLPSNLFSNTGIPVCIIILKKNRDLNEPVLFIDA